MIVHLCCFWPVKTTGCQLQKTTCDVAGCDVMKTEYRYIFEIGFVFEVHQLPFIWDSCSNRIQTWTNQNFKEWDRVVLFFGCYPFTTASIFHAMAACVISLPSTVDLAGHLSQESLTVLSWVFILLAVLSAPLMDHASQVGCNATKWGDRPSVAL